MVEFADADVDVESNDDDLEVAVVGISKWRSKTQRMLLLIWSREMALES